MLSLIIRGSVSTLMLICYTHCYAMSSVDYSEIEKEIRCFVEQKYTLEPLSYIYYTRKHIDKYDNTYIYEDQIREISKGNGYYIVPFVYSNKIKGVVQDDFQRCNIAIFTPDKRIIVSNKPFEGYFFNDYSPCIGFKKISFTHIEDKVWIKGMLGYIGPQNGEQFEVMMDEYYYFDSRQKKFCYDGNINRLLREQKIKLGDKVAMGEYVSDDRFCIR
ncbi:hypothetical protein [Escherichia coli]|uniref:hypothetical protein n=1 Tax=Escherichia coli TaxID=562 RepID=UPI0021BEA86B|nr:hypothetical protein [Escherichia coli]MCT8918764.1 hypothetical protein [Escherichia coli]HAW0505544.1 hypothetical protein [Escherichia coli]HAW4280145.1 hypothetical protein [Escherichia coli]HAW4293755.1 hypothetical protein [Escherichia coli]HBB9640797.1 hypothetical protein [Escherichia coli]